MFPPEITPLPRQMVFSGLYITPNWPGAMPWTRPDDEIIYSLSVPGTRDSLAGMNSGV